jgi:uncharacterized protein (TIGR03067 family)
MQWQLLTAVLVLAAGDDKKSDVDKLQGTWVAVSIESDGKMVPEEKVKNVKMVIKDDTMSITTGGPGRQAPPAMYKLDEKKKLKTIDITAGGRDGSGKKTDDVLPGIYEFDGDTLKICLGLPGKDRPTELSAKEGAKQTLYTYKREKKE